MFKEFYNKAIVPIFSLSDKEIIFLIETFGLFFLISFLIFLVAFHLAEMLVTRKVEMDRKLKVKLALISLLSSLFLIVDFVWVLCFPYNSLESYFISFLGFLGVVIYLSTKIFFLRKRRKKHNDDF